MGYTIWKLSGIEEYDDIEGGYILQTDETIIRFFHTFHGRIVGTGGRFFEYESKVPIKIDQACFDQKEEIAVFFGLDRVTPFLPKEHQINYEGYQEFLAFVKARLRDKHNISVNLMEWNAETTEKLEALHEQLTEAGTIGMGLGSWIADFFEAAYRKWLEEGKPAIIRGEV